MSHKNANSHATKEAKMDPYILIACHFRSHLLLVLWKSSPVRHPTLASTLLPLSITAKNCQTKTSSVLNSSKEQVKALENDTLNRIHHNHDYIETITTYIQIPLEHKASSDWLKLKRTNTFCKWLSNSCHLLLFHVSALSPILNPCTRFKPASNKTYVISSSILQPLTRLQWRTSN